jgi:hypothetical protein
MKRGRKPTPSRVKVLRGTFRPYRARDVVVLPLEGAPAPPPAWLKGSARRLWGIHCATYAQRGQAVAGCEALLAVYCTLEAELARRCRKGLEVPASLLTAYRLYAGEFFDTPATQIGRGTTAPAVNRFAQHAARNHDAHR